MTHPLIRTISACLLLTCATAHADGLAPQQEPTPVAGVTGLWLVKKKDVVVEVKPCSAGSETLCGRIAWLDPHAKQQVDSLNPDAALRTRPLCGIRVMWNMQPDEDVPGQYVGKIYKANNGTTYDANIRRTEDGRLELRGYVGIELLGKTAYLTPVKRGAYPLCTQRKAPSRKPLINSGTAPSNG